MYTFDKATVDSTGAFLIGELERLDPEIHLPLVDCQWSRDVDVRKDVTIGDEFTSFTLSKFANAGGSNSNGISWAGKNTTAESNIMVDIEKKSTPLGLWAAQISWSIVELEQSIRLNRPIDSDKLQGLNLKWNMDMDNLAYKGDASISSTGLHNNATVTVSNAANGASGSSTWASKTPAEILADINAALTAQWSSTGFALPANRILVSPAAFGKLLQPVSNAGNTSILSYVLENNIAKANGGMNIEIYASKWLTGAGVGGKDRMVVYRKDYGVARLPYTDLAFLAPQPDGLYQKVSYYGKVGALEVVRPEAIAYVDGV